MTAAPTKQHEEEEHTAIMTEQKKKRRTQGKKARKEKSDKVTCKTLEKRDDVYKRGMAC